MTVSRVILVRHGESTANVAATAAELAGLETIAVETRDADVPLSALGRQQAAGAGTLLGWLDSEDRYDQAALQAYVAEHENAEVYASTFNDYSGPDGAWRTSVMTFPVV